MAKITCTSCKEEKYIDCFHKGERRCKPCRKEKAAKYYLSNRERILKRTASYNKANPEVSRKAMTKYRKNNPNKDKEWKDNNRDKIRMYWQKRYAAKKNSVPSWLDEDDNFLLQEIYDLCEMRNRMTNEVWEVDHIVPLQGKGVCGLHVPWNLQVLTREQNRLKGNKHYG